MGVSLPPGWYPVWDAGSDAHYFVDAETQTSQWEPPPAYVHKDWKRHVDPNGKAIWSCHQLGILFYETNAGMWERFADKEGRTYWSNQSASLRFFEEFSSSLP